MKINPDLIIAGAAVSLGIICILDAMDNKPLFLALAFLCFIFAVPFFMRYAEQKK